jgi:hypothetical protein
LKARRSLPVVSRFSSSIAASFAQWDRARQKDSGFSLSIRLKPDNDFSLLPLAEAGGNLTGVNRALS